MNLPDNNILDLLISLTLIYALLSIFVSILTEWWNHYRKERGKNLKEAIFKLLKDPFNHDYGDLFYNHYMIEGLKSAANKPPQYISSGMFAEVFIDTIARQVVHTQKVELEKRDVQAEGVVSDKKYNLSGDAPPENVMERFKASIKIMNPSPFRDLVQSFLSKSGDSYENLKPHIENWFNDYMDRVSGWYKSKQRRKLIYIGLIVAFGLNVDSLHLIKVLSLDENLRNNLVATAEKVAVQYSALSDSARENNSELINLFKTELPDSFKKDSSAIPPVKSVLTYFIEKDSVKYGKIINKLQLNDSLSIALMSRADSILGIAASLNIPIGWSDDSAPLSWCCKKDSYSKKQIYHSKTGLMAYNENRNNFPDEWIKIKYLLGIFISGISLSFGAPFWFDLLVKLVNIRRAGNKPTPQTVKK